MKTENKKLILGLVLVVITLSAGYIGYTVYRSYKNGLISSYINQKTAIVSGEDIVIVKKSTVSTKAILAGYEAVKYHKTGEVESGVFFFNGNFEPDGKNKRVSWWEILLIGYEKYDK